MKKLLAMLLALMMVLSILTVAVFAQSTDNVDDEPGDDNITVNDPEPDSNPKTGVALAVVPMMVAAAAAAVSKKH